MALNTETVNFDNYELEPLRTAVVSVFDVASAARTVLVRVIPAALVVGLLAWLAFRDRAGAVSVIVFAIGAAVLAMFPAFLWSVWVVVRRKAEAVRDAAAESVDVMAAVGDDVARIAEGSIEAPTYGAVAGELMSSVVFPSMDDVAMTWFPGFLAPLIAPLARFGMRPAKWSISRSVTRVIKVLDLEGKRLTEVGGAGRLLSAAARTGDGVGGISDKIERQTHAVSEAVERTMRWLKFPLVALSVVSLLPLAVWIVGGYILA